MKKFFLLSVIILSTLALSAQYDDQQNTNRKPPKKEKVSGGLYLKGGTSWLMSDSKNYFSNKGAKMTYGFGAIMDWHLTNNFSLNIAAGFNNLGGTAVFKNGVETFKDIDGTELGDTLMHNYKYSTSYIEVPIGIKGCTNEIGYFTYFLKIGVDPMVRLKSKVTLEDKKTYIITKQANLFNIGWHIGGGMEWSLAGNTKLLVELLYQGTFIDMDRVKTYKDDMTTLDPSIKMNDISLKVGVIF